MKRTDINSKVTIKEVTDFLYTMSYCDKDSIEQPQKYYELFVALCQADKTLVDALEILYIKTLFD